MTKAVFLLDSCLDPHNIFRKLHKDTPEMTWDVEIQTSAQTWANYLVQTLFIAHSQSGYGENLYISYSMNDPNVCQNAVKAW